MASTAHSMRTFRPVPAALLIVGVAFVIALAPATAFAYKEPNDIPGNGCNCHYMYWDGFSWTMGDPPSAGVCVDCHGGPYEGATAQAQGFSANDSIGPHGGYITTTRKCATCHTVHDAPAAGDQPRDADHPAPRDQEQLHEQENDAREEQHELERVDGLGPAAALHHRGLDLGHRGIRHAVADIFCNAA